MAEKRFRRLRNETTHVHNWGYETEQWSFVKLSISPLDGFNRRFGYEL